MAVPSQTDLDKKKEKLEECLKKLNPDGTLKEKVLMQMLRSAVREQWMRAPNKLAFLETNRISDMNPNTRTKWLFECRQCKCKFKEADIQVDHIEGEHTLLDINDFINFVLNIANASYLTDLQILCKPCHEIKTLAERRGITFEEAIIEKEVITFLKNKANKQKEILLAIDPQADVRNPETREQEYRRLFIECS